MKLHKKVLGSLFVLMFLSCGNTFAQTCYDPYYGYYDCNPSYNYYPDQGQALMAGAVLGLIIGGFATSGGHWGDGDHHWHHGGGGGWGGHHGGGGGGGHHH